MYDVILCSINLNVKYLIVKMFCLLYCILKVIDLDIVKYIIVEKKYIIFFNWSVKIYLFEKKFSYIMYNE